MDRIAGYATPDGTHRLATRFAPAAAPGHFRQLQGLWLSSIGLGTYLGPYDDETDRRYEKAVAHALGLGCNVLDSAINYRMQRSERNIGAALHKAIEQGTVARDEVVLATKGGFLSYDSAPPRDPSAYIADTYLDAGIVKPEEIAAGCHCMSPRYLADQVERSLANLGVECIDIYYIHNPETQLGDVDRREFLRRLRVAFESLEALVLAGKIRLYGTATWNGYRVEPHAGEHLSLAEILDAAEAAGGSEHHCRVVQLPFNLALTEAFTKRTQKMNDANLTLLEAAQRRNISVVGSASIYEGQLSRKLPEFLHRHFEGLTTDAQRAIQFARSTPGLAVALVGMSHDEHVEENMALARVAPLDLNAYLAVFAR